MTMTLMMADVVRDGGSLFAMFRRNDGSMLCLELSVARPPRQPTQYQMPLDGTEVILKGSNAEAEIASDLDGWLASPCFDQLADETSLRYVQELRERMLERIE